jgi:hypothetical protein
MSPMLACLNSAVSCTQVEVGAVCTGSMPQPRFWSQAGPIWGLAAALGCLVARQLRAHTEPDRPISPSCFSVGLQPQFCDFGQSDYPCVGLAVSHGMCICVMPNGC